MATLRGWAPCGTRLTAKVPHGHWKTTTFLAALRYDRIEAPWVLDGPIDGESFAIYIERVLLPILQPGDIVIMDNLGSHKGKAVRAFIRSRGAKLFFLPKYSPDLNPITSNGTQSACDDGAIDPIAVSDHVTGSLVPRKGLGYLTSNPLCCRVGCDVDPDRIRTIMKPYSSLKPMVGTTNKSMAAMSGAWFRRKVFHP